MRTLALALLSILLSLAGHAQPTLAQGKPGIERLYVLYCGDIALTDQGRFSPGLSGPGNLSVTCYLIKHSQGWLLFDTGLGDSVAAKPEGQKSNSGVWYNKKTLASQLAEIGVRPSDIRYLAFSHAHGDHVGNIAMFPQATLLVQKAEYDSRNPAGMPPFNPDQAAVKAEGDHDVFGDGSVTLISTPGHSPGHQCLLVKMPKTGALLFSGDAVHTKYNWDNRRPQSNNAQSLASLDRMSEVLKQHNATLWIGHEPTEVPLRKYAPAYYE